MPPTWNRPFKSSLATVGRKLSRTAVGCDPNVAGQPQTSPPTDYYTPNYTEFMYILEGSVTLEDKDGREDTFKAGDAVIVPRGVPVKWKQSQYIKKYWVIYDVDPSSTTDGP